MLILTAIDLKMLHVSFHSFTKVLKVPITRLSNLRVQVHPIMLTVIMIFLFFFLFFFFIFIYIRISYVSSYSIIRQIVIKLNFG
jgi:hypothetical protein